MMLQSLLSHFALRVVGVTAAIVLLGALLLSSPAASQTPGAAADDMPTPTMTRTPTITRTPKDTRTPTPTRTPSVTRTPTATKTPSPIRTVAPTVTPKPTIRITNIASGALLEGNQNVRFSVLDPDGLGIQRVELLVDQTTAGSSASVALHHHLGYPDGAGRPACPQRPGGLCER
jgi:hypothetical protein